MISKTPPAAGGVQFAINWPGAFAGGVCVKTSGITTRSPPGDRMMALTSNSSGSQGCSASGNSEQIFAFPDFGSIGHPHIMATLARMCNFREDRRRTVSGRIDNLYDQAWYFEQKAIALHDVLARINPLRGGHRVCRLARP